MRERICPGCRHSVAFGIWQCPACGCSLVGVQFRGLPLIVRALLLVTGSVAGLIFLGLVYLAVTLPDKPKEAPAPAPVVASTVASSAAPTGVLLLAGKGEGEIADGLGQPVSREATKYGPKLTYRLGSGATVEIVYIDGKADWITMTPPPGRAVPFGPAAIAGIGLASATPKSITPDVICWEHAQGLREVSVHAGAAGMVGYYLIKVRTE